MNPRTKIQPVFVEVSLRNAIARRLREHGIPEFDTIADEVTLDLTGKRVVNPPEGVPHKFTINGVQLVWPQGLDTRVPDAHEREPFNRALSSEYVWTDGRSYQVSTERITDEDNVRVLRTCYASLWKRVCAQANERAEQMRVEPPTAPVVTTSMLEGRNPVLEAEVVVKPKRARKKKVEPVVSQVDTLTSLQDDLSALKDRLGC